MAKTLVIAEKPSVGRDLARVLPGPFAKQEGWLEAPDYVITWAVGHLVQLAEPDEYDDKYKRWRMPDLPIVPARFKLVVRDERSRKQMSVVSAQLRRDDIGEVINACDAGREGELIFAYLYEKAKADKPVKRLWLNSMTSAAMKEAFATLRPAEEMALLEQAARSRSEADWIVGMNATRAATIRLRTSFDGAVSLGRVQTPTLAILTRREEEIRAFVPEPYWLVDATFAGEPLEGGSNERTYVGRFHDPTRVDGKARGPRIASEEQASAIVKACQRRHGTITKLEKKEQRERAPMLYDLTSLQRDANTRFGFSARRTLAAAQRLYEEHKALTYPRTNSRYLTSDMIAEIKPTAELVGGRKEYAQAAAYVTSLEKLPLGRVVNNEKVTDHHAIIPTRSEHAVERMGDDDKRVYDMVVRRFLAIFHPEAVFENTRVETTVQLSAEEAAAANGGASGTAANGNTQKANGNAEEAAAADGNAEEAAAANGNAEKAAVADASAEKAAAADGNAEKAGAATVQAGSYLFRTRGRLLVVPGWRGVYGEMPTESKGDSEDDEASDQQLPRLLEGEQVDTREIDSARKETKPPRRYSDASLLGAMETAGKLVDDDELREAMKDSGIGTPATRAAIIERLIAVGYVERDGRSLVATEKGLNVVRLLDGHPLTSPELTGNWEHRLGKIEQGEDSRERFMQDIAVFADDTVKDLDGKLKDIRIPRASLGPCPVCGHPIMENRKGYSCWAREDPGCGFVIWKGKAGKQMGIPIARELIKTGYTARPVTGFRGRSGRSFRAHLALSQSADGKWRVEFNEPWAREGAKPPDHETLQAAEAVAAAGSAA
jgi:DNA topoisomerase IA